METVGVIAEYNPFHSGHKYLIEATKAKISSDCAVLAVMSGNWVQQCHCAIADKWTRTELALEGGVDLIIELPTLWATASAERFAHGAISLLESTGVVDYLTFGSELGQLSPLQTVANVVKTEEFSKVLKQELQAGVSFPVARQRAVEKILGQDCDVLENPNNILGIEYLKALNQRKSNISPVTISREGAGFHSVENLAKKQRYTSATDLRDKIQKQQWEYLKGYLSESGETLFKNRDIPLLSYSKRGILARLCSMSSDDWAKLPDSGAREGLNQRLEKIGHEVSSVTEFLEQSKTKRYPMARLRRLLLWAYLGVEESQFHENPSYIRVLGFGTKGQKLLHEMKQKAKLPILTKTAQIRQLSPEAQDLFRQEVRFTDLYGLCFPKILPRGEEWKRSPVVETTK